MTIPNGLLKPDVYNSIDTVSGVTTIAGSPASIVILAQKTASGTALADTLIPTFSVGQSFIDAGAGSIGHLAAVAAIKSNSGIELFMVYQDDNGSATDAVGTITISGTPTAAGLLQIWVGASQIQVAVSVTDTPTTIAAAIDTAIGEIPEIPVTSGAVAGVVTITAKNGGTLANSIATAFDVNDIVGITVVVVQLTGGLLDPSLTAGYLTIFPTDIRHILSTYNDATSLGTLKSEIDASSDALENRPRLGWTGIGTLATAPAASLANGLNEERISIGSKEYVKTTPQGHSTDPEIGAAYIAKYAQSTDPALPRNGLELPGIIPTALENKFSRGEQEFLLGNGVTPLVFVPGDNTTIVRSVSTRTLTAGITDLTLLDIQTMDSLDFVGTTMRTRFKIRYQREKINDRLIKKMRSEVLDVLFQIQDLEIVRDVEANKDRVLVIEDPTNRGQVNLSIPAEIVPGLHVINQTVVLIIN